MTRAEVVRSAESSPLPLVLLGSSVSAKRLVDDIQSAAGAGGVLIQGEAGLELVEVGRAIHGRSRRAGSCVELDCGAAEPSLVERELFGHPVRRASGDAETIGAQSALARAAGGTLYLGDVSELSTTAQARLARVARDGEVWVGGATVMRALDVSLVAALSADLDAEIHDGRLRRDLLRHLTRARVVVPGLRRRPEDIPLMVDALVALLCDEAHTHRKTVTQAAVTLLAAMPWHGNLVELRHALARIVGGVPGDRIQLEDVLAHVRFDTTRAAHAPAGTLRTARQQFEREYIALVLRRHQGRVGDAARALGIQRTNLYRKARQLGISVVRPPQ